MPHSAGGAVKRLEAWDVLSGSCLSHFLMYFWQLSTTRRQRIIAQPKVSISFYRIRLLDTGQVLCCCKIELHFDSKLISDSWTTKSKREKEWLDYFSPKIPIRRERGVEYQSFFRRSLKQGIFVLWEEERVKWMVSHSGPRAMYTVLTSLSLSLVTTLSPDRGHRGDIGSGSGSSVSAQSWLSRSANSAAISRSAMQRVEPRANSFRWWGPS